MDHPLIIDFHSIFLDACNTLKRNEDILFSIKQRNSLRAYSFEYRKSLRKCQESDNRNENECNQIKVTHAIWHMAEASLLSGGTDSPLVLSVLECLREDFLYVEDLSILVNNIVSRLKSQSAATDDLLAFDTFDVMVRLTLQGSARDAGNLLRILALLRHDTAFLAVAELLSSFPALGLVAVGTGAVSYSNLWDIWREKAIALRQQFSVDHSQTLRGTIWSSNQTEPSLFNITKALLDVLSGNIMTDPSNSPLRQLYRKGKLINQTLEEDGIDWAWTWEHLYICTILYGSNTSPSLFGRSALKIAMESSIRAVGLTLTLSEPVNNGTNTEQIDDYGDETGAFFNSTLVQTLDGDALASICMMRRSSCCGQFGTLASAHLSDLLWRAGYLNSTPQDSNLSDYSLRSRLLLSYSKILIDQNSNYSRIALSYTLAATPEFALNLCQISPTQIEQLLQEAKNSPAASATATACAARSSTPAEAISAILLSILSSSLSSIFQTAKLAILSGTASAGISTGNLSSAYTLAAHIIKSSPIQCDRDCASLISLVSRAGLNKELSDWISRSWSRKCLEQGKFVPSIIWALRINDIDGIKVIANALQQRVDTAIYNEFKHVNTFRPLTYTIIINKLRVIDDCSRVLDEVLFSISGHREDHIDCSGIAPLPFQLEKLSSSSAFLRLRHTRKLMALILYGALESDRRFKTQTPSLTLSAENRAVDEDVGLLVRAAGSHLARLVEINDQNGGRPFVNAFDVGKLLSVSIHCGILHAGLRPHGTLGLDLADEATERMRSPILEADINAILARIEVEHDNIGFNIEHLEAMRAVIGKCVIRTMQ